MKLVQLIFFVLVIASCGESVVNENEIVTAEKVVNEDVTDTISANFEADSIEVTVDQQRPDTLRLNSVTVAWRKKGVGNKINAGDCVRFDYTLKNIRGEKLDGSDKLGFPIGVIQGMGLVVPGLDTALAHAFVGDEIVVWIDSEVGFGKDFSNNLVKQGEQIIYNIKVKERVEAIAEKGVEVYKVVDGGGSSIDPGDIIAIDYIAFLEDGKVYDTSRKNGESFEFPVGENKVIEGLDIGVLKLNVGDQAFIKIPSEMGYGRKGLTDLVPPNTNLLYKVTIDYKK